MEATTRPAAHRAPRPAQPLRYVQRGAQFRLEPATLIQPGDRDCGAMTDAQFGCAVAQAAVRTPLPVRAATERAVAAFLASWQVAAEQGRFAS